MTGLTTSIEEFAKVANVLKHAYPANKFLSDTYSVKLWHSFLNDIPLDRLLTAVQLYILENKFPPTISEIRGLAVETKTGVSDWSVGWGDVKAAIRRFGMYREDEALNSFDTVTAETVKRIGWKSICTSESDEAVDRAQFRQIYEQVANRERQKNLMPDKLKIQIASMMQPELTANEA